MNTPRKIATTQEHVDIEEIRDGIVLLKNGTASVVIQTTAVNFDLLSESEQDAMIYAFAALLNSLSFPIQILVRTKRMDVTNYLSRIAAAKGRVSNTSLTAQIEKYEGFIRDLVSKNQVLDKRFYVVVPYIGLDLSQVKSNLGGFFSRRTQGAAKWSILEKARVNLDQKVNYLQKQFNRLGIKTAPLSTEELVELYYDLYNPELAREQKAALGTWEYTTPIVEPSLVPTAEGSAAEDSNKQPPKPAPAGKTPPAPESPTDWDQEEAAPENQAERSAAPLLDQPSEPAPPLADSSSSVETNEGQKVVGTIPEQGQGEPSSFPAQTKRPREESQPPQVPPSNPPSPFSQNAASQIGPTEAAGGGPPAAPNLDRSGRQQKGGV